MSAFTGSLTITSLDEDCRMRRPEQPLIYEIGNIGSGRFVIVPPAV